MGTVEHRGRQLSELCRSSVGALSESVGVCRSCRRTIVGALSDCRNRAQDAPWATSSPPSPAVGVDAQHVWEDVRAGPPWRFGLS